jgi:hypothetical protein
MGASPTFGLDRKATFFRQDIMRCERRVRTKNRIRGITRGSAAARPGVLIPKKPGKACALWSPDQTGRGPGVVRLRPGAVQRPGQMPMPSIALILYHGRPHILDARLVLEGHSRIV